MVQDEAERQRLIGILEGLVNSVKTFGLYPEGGEESLKDLNGVEYRGSVRIE